ncbi:hypothetical protein D3C87_1351210 [compost metagenome]
MVLWIVGTDTAQRWIGPCLRSVAAGTEVVASEESVDDAFTCLTVFVEDGVDVLTFGLAGATESRRSPSVMDGLEALDAEGRVVSLLLNIGEAVDRLSGDVGVANVVRQNTVVRAINKWHSSLQWRHCTCV